ncbi:hypothetical protein PVAG01_07116 [Phlyctema vagabunda]|uniref:Uncharacterized protein n=1 Tax=Phlyctema vagabunda TaxID=108571 RepID=A0ABR4PBI5_9HELO
MRRASPNSHRLSKLQRERHRLDSVPTMCHGRVREWRRDLIEHSIRLIPCVLCDIVSLLSMPFAAVKGKENWEGDVWS